MRENDIATKVIGAALEVHQVLGPGLLERVYRECLLYKLNQHGLFTEKEKAIPIRFEGIDFGCGYRADILVEHKLIVEVKCTEALHVIHFAQLLTYLKLGGFKLGLLINFNELKLKHGIRRVVNGL